MKNLPKFFWGLARGDPCLRSFRGGYGLLQFQEAPEDTRGRVFSSRVLSHFPLELLRCFFFLDLRDGFGSPACVHQQQFALLLFLLFFIFLGWYEF